MIAETGNSRSPLFVSKVLTVNFLCGATAQKRVSDEVLRNDFWISHSSHQSEKPLQKPYGLNDQRNEVAHPDTFGVPTLIYSQPVADW